MIFKKKNLLVQLGQYQKGQILFYDKKSKSLLAINETVSYRPLSQLTLANSYVIGYAILAFISGLFTPQNVLLKLLLLFICQCVMSYYADKLQNLQLKEATFYTVDITVFDKVVCKSKAVAILVAPKRRTVLYLFCNCFLSLGRC